MNIEKASQVLAKAVGLIFDGTRSDGIDEYTYPDGSHKGFNIKTADSREVVREWWLNNNEEASVCFFKDGVEYEWLDEHRDAFAIYDKNEKLCQIKIAEGLENE